MRRHLFYVTYGDGLTRFIRIDAETLVKAWAMLVEKLGDDLIDVVRIELNSSHPI